MQTRRCLVKLLRFAFVLAIFVVSLIPAIYTFGKVPERYQPPPLQELQEMRPLAPLHTHWEGRWYDLDKNYHTFERGFSDHLGLRNLMVRAKNELDFVLFNSSRRVYFGKQDEIYGRSMSDLELPNTEKLLADRHMAEAVYQGTLKLAAKLEAQGTTMVLVLPVSKQYFTQDRIPRFLPRVQLPSHFMQLYQRLKATPGLHMVDVYDLIDKSQGKFPIYYRQDFHWTDLTAMTVAQDTINRIAAMEQRPPAWRYAMESFQQPFIGSEARFAALLLERPLVYEPFLKKTWQDVHQTIPMDPKATGFEFVTDKVSDKGLLPPACMFGNSFGDGMLRAGLADHFEQFTKLDRALLPNDLPPLINGRCKYLIVQILDNASSIFLSLAD